MGLGVGFGESDLFHVEGVEAEAAEWKGSCGRLKLKGKKFSNFFNFNCLLFSSTRSNHNLIKGTCVCVGANFPHQGN